MRRRGISTFAAGLIALLIIIPLVYLGFAKSIPFRHHFEIRAAFSSANNLRKGSPVRIAGVDIGKVTKVEHVGGGRAGVVTMQLQNRGLPIHRDATAKIRPRIFLEGNFFVDVQPGTPSSPALGDGGTIPIQQTSAPVQFDQVLTSLQSDTRRNLQAALAGYGRAVSRGGAGYNRSIPFWGPAYRAAAITNTAALGRRPHDLSRSIAAAGTAAAALDAHPGQLRDLVTNLDVTTAAFAREAASLSAGVAELPGTLRTALPALASLERALPPTQRLARALLPAVRSTGPTIDASLPWLAQVRALVSPAELGGLSADLKQTVPPLAALSSRAVPLSRQTRLAASCQNEVIVPFTHDSVPNVEGLPLKYKLPVYQESVKFLPGIAGESATSDANGQWFRVLIGGGAYSYKFAGGRFGNSLAPVKGFVPPKPTTRPPIRPTVPCETQQRPDLGATPSAGPVQIAGPKP